ncbi:galactose-specific lectin nattectin-like [Nematolebias whitei]|uniref:galactose-specific lectin nattectin-like n=1 Tax=Nematolebias whitei TaxID=451745 RepID=UPI0018983B7C|nr:galactose-specific lectin nattectin-like [Nematolebias whitei]
MASGLFFSLLICLSGGLLTEATLDCVKNGGNLASYHSKAEYDTIRGFIKTVMGYDTSSWVGGSDTAHKGVWLWSDGSEFSYGNWGSGTPNHGKHRNCMEINYEERDYVNNIKCSKKRPYVCAKSLQMCMSC